MEKTAGGHGIIKFHTNNNETFLVDAEEVDRQDPKFLEKYKAIRNIHQISGHKMEDNMIKMYKQSGEDDTLTRKLINEVVKRCFTCQSKKKSSLRPKVAMMKAKTPNDVITLDLKQFDVRGKKVNVLWMICAFSRLAVGKVLKSKEGSEVVKAIEDGWIYTWGCPSSGFWSDNGKKFVNKDMEDLCERWKIKIWCSIFSMEQWNK